jgi:hypothetical protein
MCPGSRLRAKALKDVWMTGKVGSGVDWTLIQSPEALACCKPAKGLCRQFQTDFLSWRLAVTWRERKRVSFCQMLMMECLEVWSQKKSERLKFGRFDWSNALLLGPQLCHESSSFGMKQINRRPADAFGSTSIK